MDPDRARGGLIRGSCRSPYQKKQKNQNLPAHPFPGGAF